MKASDLIVHCLENEGVRYVFGVPGEEILDILESLTQSTLPFIPTRHEQGAAFMADVQGRLCGRAGVCLSTLGPGATNLMTGVADANLDHSPDVGAHKMWIARLFPCERPNTCIISNGFASMGIALPGAIAAKLLFPDKKVVAATGDGGFLMNSQELETALRLGVPFVTLIFHDATPGSVTKIGRAS